MSHHFIQLPPDSTGKRSTQDLTINVDYTGHDPQTMKVKQTIIGAQSGTEGVIVRITPNEGDPTAGSIDVLIDVDTEGVVYTVGENLRVNGTTVCQAASTGTHFHAQHVVLAGGNSSFNIAAVDEAGSLFVRNLEGDPQYDAFGLARGSSPSIIAEYNFAYDALPSDLWQTGTVTHLPNEASVALDVDTSSGSTTAVASHAYHRYQPGFGQTINITATCGDSGKAGVVRRWGYFDDNNGLFFELGDDQILYVVERTSTSGSVVETKVAQSDWNVDRADGSGNALNLSSMNLDVSKTNIYWIDFAWLGAGIARFGVFDTDGGRVTLHKFENPNSQTVPFMKTGSLPIRAEVFNTAVTGSPTRLKMTCASVMTDGRLIIDKQRRAVKRSITVPNVSSISTEVPLLSVRSALTFNSLTNRKVSIPKLYTFFVQDQPVLIRLRKNATLTGPSWTSVDGSAVEYDSTATAVADGEEVLSFMLDPGAHNPSAVEDFDVQGENIKLSADGTHGDVFTFTAESLGTDAQVRAGITWTDID